LVRAELKRLALRTGLEVMEVRVSDLNPTPPRPAATSQVLSPAARGDDAPAPQLRLRFRNWLLYLAYRMYERRLSRQVLPYPVPRHVGIILDGNRRYGQERNLTDPSEIYTAGANKLDELLNWCIELGIPAITLWVLSTDNLSREPDEIRGILSAIEGKLSVLAQDPRIHCKRIRVRAVGRLELLPEETVAALRAAEASTKGHDGMCLTIAAAYGGRQEITDAVQSVLRECLQRGNVLEDAIAYVTPEAVGRHLYSPELPDPDLIIRTSGEIRLSGFLRWQSVHSEFYFADVFWPAFRKIDLLRAVRAFQQRKRRFGQ
jgi:short-chain Z-isoprenyl diphosphate synthase